MNHNLTWAQAAWLVLALACAAAVLRAVAGGRFAASRAPRWPRRAAVAARFLGEAALVVALYSAWQWVGGVSRRATAGAVAHGEGVLDVEHALGLPSEHTVQGWLLPHPLLTQAANLYYATAHFGAMIAVLAWVFTAHRRSYGPLRTITALATAACFAVSLIRVAPPRLLPHAGFTDTAAQYGQSVYAAAGALSPDEVSAMPSVHVAWALIVAAAVWRLGGRRWRWLGPAHAVLTVAVVVATANHYWLDGIVAAAIVAAAAGVTAAGRRAVALTRFRPRSSRTSAPPPGSTGGTAPRGARPASPASTCATRSSCSGSRPCRSSSPPPDPRRTRPPARSSR